MILLPFVAVGLFGAAAGAALTAAEAQARIRRGVALAVLALLILGPRLAG